MKFLNGWKTVGGVAGIVGLLIPAPNCAGVGLRTQDQADDVWLKYWMNAKVGLVGGEGKIESKKGRGTTIVVDIPLVKKETIPHGED